MTDLRRLRGLESEMREEARRALEADDACADMESVARTCALKLAEAADAIGRLLRDLQAEEDDRR